MYDNYKVRLDFHGSLILFPVGWSGDIHMLPIHKLPADLLCTVASHLVCARPPCERDFLALASVSRAVNQAVRAGMPTVLAAVQCRELLRVLSHKRSLALHEAVQSMGVGGAWDTTLKLQRQVEIDSALPTSALDGTEVSILVHASARYMQLFQPLTPQLRMPVLALMASAGRLCAIICRAGPPPTFSRLAPLAHVLAAAELQSGTPSEDEDEPEWDAAWELEWPDHEISLARLPVTGAFLAAALTADRVEAMSLRQRGYWCMSDGCPCCRLLSEHTYWCTTRPF